MILRTSSLPPDPSRNAKARAISVFPAGNEWLVKGDATAELGSELRRFASRAEALDYARELAANSRPSVLSVETREGIPD
jgi:hypothetical protein